VATRSAPCAYFQSSPPCVIAVVGNRPWDAAIAEPIRSVPTIRSTASRLPLRNVGTPVVFEIWVDGFEVADAEMVTRTDRTSVGVWYATREPSGSQARCDGVLASNVTCSGLVPLPRVGRIWICPPATKATFDPSGEISAAVPAASFTVYC